MVCKHLTKYYPIFTLTASKSSIYSQQFITHNQCWQKKVLSICLTVFNKPKGWEKLLFNDFSLRKSDFNWCGLSWCYICLFFPFQKFNNLMDTEIMEGKSSKYLTLPYRCSLSDTTLDTMVLHSSLLVAISAHLFMFIPAYRETSN